MEPLEVISLLDHALTVLSVIGGAGVIAASPVAKVLKHIPVAKKVLDIVAMNIGEAKNKK